MRFLTVVVLMLIAALSEPWRGARAAEAALSPTQRLELKTAETLLQDALTKQAAPAGDKAAVGKAAPDIRKHLAKVFADPWINDLDAWRVAGTFAASDRDHELADWALEAILRLAPNWEKDQRLAIILPRLNALAEETRVQWIGKEREYAASLSVEKQAKDTRTSAFCREWTMALGGLKEIVNSVGIKLVRIKSGEFLMGSPADEEGRFHNEDQHRVHLTRSFYLGATEVTQAQWKAVTGDNPSASKWDDLPVEMVSWDDAILFCRKLSEREGRKYRLPTEAEWEYACRAGSSGPYAGTGRLEQMGWFDGNSDKTTKWVGGKAPNSWGLYDMHGNVWEWCADYYASYLAEEAVDPKGPAQGGNADLRVIRGGAWNNDPRSCRAGVHNGFAPDTRRSDFGFRLALDSQ